MSSTPVNASDIVHTVLREAFFASNIANYTQAIADMEKPEPWQTWGVGLAIVSACSFSAPLGMLLLPCLSTSLYERIMTFLIALGIGALSGSTMFIMVPQAFTLPDLEAFAYHDKSVIMLCSLYLFFAVDRALQYILEFRRRRQAKRRVHKSTIAAIMRTPKLTVRNATEETIVSRDEVSYPANHEDRESQRDRETAELAEDLEIAMMNNALTRTFSTRRSVAMISAVDDIEYADGRDRKTEKHGGDFLEAVGHEFQRSLSSRRSKVSPEPPVEYKCKQKGDDEVSVSVRVVEKRVIEPAKIEVAAVAYMIIFGSSANNFVDGMSMGAAFSDSLLRGLSIGIAVISQQFPQELGTLAILVKSGLGIKKTLLFNLLPIVLSYLGFIIGVFLDNVDESYDDYIFAVSSGMYMYIFLGTLIPEIRESTNELIKQDIVESFLVTALQVCGIAVGVTFMFFMSKVGNIEI